MITRTFKLCLNAGTGSAPYINVNQYDSGEQWLFELYNEDGTRYTPSTGAIIGLKADGNAIANNGTVDSEGRVVITETEQMTAAAGRSVFELSIDGNTHGTANFIVKAERKPTDDAEMSDSDLSLIQQAIDSTNPQAIAEGVSDWMDEHLTPTTPVVDDTLTVAGAAADAKATGDRIAEIEVGGDGLTSAIKSALLQIAQKVAYIDEYGQTYYDALYNALYPPADLVSISAVYTQSGTVYDTDSLEDLKTDLVVTANMSDGTSETVTTYTLSGTLAEGTSTITVSYGNKTATFNVTVTHAVQRYTITNNLTHVTNTNNATSINENLAYNAALTVGTGYLMSSATVTMGGVDITATAYDSSNNTISIASVTGNIIITAEAIEDVGWISGVPYDITWKQGNVNTDGTIYEGGNYYYTEEYLPCHNASAIKYATNGNISGNHYRAYYDENYDFIKYDNTFYPDVSENHILIPDNAYYVRFTVPKAEYNAGVTLTPYLYPTLDENTVWQTGQIYEFAGLNQLMFCYGAETITLLTDACMYGYRGYYSLYDSAKQRTNSMSNTNNFNRTPITVASTDYYFALSATVSDAKFLIKLS